MVMQNIFYPGNNKKNFQAHLQCSLSSVYEMLWLISQESEYLSISLKDLVMK